MTRKKVYVWEPSDVELVHGPPPDPYDATRNARNFLYWVGAAVPWSTANEFLKLLRVDSDMEPDPIEAACRREFPGWPERK